jgi:hypothetical protein
MAESNEVALPSTRTIEPEALEDTQTTAYRVSAAGAALRAEMDKASGKSTVAPTGIEQLTESERDARHNPKPTITDPDSGTVLDLLDGKETPGTPPEGDDGAVVPELALIPVEYHEEAAQIALDLEAIGAAHDYPAERMQTAMDAAADLHLSIERDMPPMTRESAHQAMVTRYGAEAAERIISEAQRQAAWMGESFQAYLNQTGLGNSLAALNVLGAAFRGDLSLTPAQAREKIAALRKGDDAMNPDVIDRVKILSRVANPKDKRAIADSRATSARVTSSVGAYQSAKELRAELDALSKPDSDLFNADNTKRSKAVKRRQQIQQQLGAN